MTKEEWELFSTEQEYSIMGMQQSLYSCLYRLQEIEEVDQDSDGAWYWTASGELV